MASQPRVDLKAIPKFPAYNRLEHSLEAFICQPSWSRASWSRAMLHVNFSRRIVTPGALRLHEESFSAVGSRSLTGRPGRKDDSFAKHIL
jgi:hypothetical protein